MRNCWLFLVRIYELLSQIYNSRFFLNSPVRYVFSCLSRDLRNCKVLRKDSSPRGVPVITILGLSKHFKKFRDEKFANRQHGRFANFFFNLLRSIKMTLQTPKFIRWQH
jgi:hypothetical protein